MKIFHNILYKFLRLFLIIILFFSFCNFYKEENKEIHQEEIIYEAKQETISRIFKNENDPTFVYDAPPKSIKLIKK